MDLKERLQTVIQGEVEDDKKTLARYSRDASLFEVQPQAVVFPKDVKDLKSLVKFVSGEKKKDYRQIYLTARSGGSDMTGGPLGESIIVDFSRHFNGPVEVKPSFAKAAEGRGRALAEPGVFYRDFEKETLKYNLILPSFPASREICTVGGMAANNAGGEKTLVYGKTARYVKGLKVVLSDGNEYALTPLDREALDAKLKLDNFEGEIYRRIYEIVNKNYDLLQSAKPKVHKNSAGYALWDVWNKEIFDLTQLFVGSQGTLGLITKINFELVEPKPCSRMLVIFLRDLKPLAKLVNRVLEHKPETFESYDHHTLKLAIRFIPQFVKLLKGNIVSVGWKFLPEIGMILKGGMPKLVLTAEFTGEGEEEVLAKVSQAREAVQEFRVKSRITESSAEIDKYHWIRRESFNLLRHKIKDKQTAPFIDDIIVPPDSLPEFLPKLEEIMGKYDLTYTIAGHIGEGNFHIIPLMNLSRADAKEVIHKLTDDVYQLVFRYGGSMTAEHNDGLIRSPYLKQMYGEEVYALFHEVKRIFDPDNIFNPGKKVGASLEYALAHLKHPRQ
ncbi:MAG: FAD-binding oxidoreductase [Candidatus Colwellbacteria bacterium]|nr:FAD-binding oxidoreductase [Candidatus Colwellbacteria bacterium]